MNVVEQERVELLYSCMNQFARTASESVQFDKTVHSLQTALENPQKGKLKNKGYAKAQSYIYIHI